MIIGTTDIFLLVIIVSSLVIGFFWGSVRSLMAFGAWIFAFGARTNSRNSRATFGSRRSGHTSINS